MTPEELDRLWTDQTNWTPPGIYRCAADPRVIVPKRVRWAGWTVNFAHPAAWSVVLASVVVAIGPTLALQLSGTATPGRVILALAASIALLVLGSAWEASRNR